MTLTTTSHVDINSFKTTTENDVVPTSMITFCPNYNYLAICRSSQNGIGLVVIIDTTTHWRVVSCIITNDGVGTYAWSNDGAYLSITGSTYWNISFYARYEECVVC
jgi:hypothetical protein